MQPQTNNFNSYNYQPQRSRSAGRRIFDLLTFAALVAVFYAVLVHRQDIIDWWRLRQYQAPAPVAQLATQDTMTDYARKVYYVNQPSIEPKASFSTQCPNNGGEQTIVLGCYRGGQSGIFLLSVNDPRLNGVQQVTAAHEMLHAAYDRLGSSERDRVNAMLEDYYNNQLADQRIRNTIEAYKKTEPNDLVNEMHSIFGSEIAVLPSRLEQYYKQYFTNRQQVATYASQYQSEFTTRQAAIASYDAQLNSLKSQIDSLEGDLKIKLSGINNQKSQLDNLRSSSAQAYNAAVPSYNALVSAYNAEVAQLRGLIDRYNNLVAVRNNIALEADQLSKELSSDTSTINQ